MISSSEHSSSMLWLAVGLPRTFTVCIITVAYYSNVIYAVYIYKYIYISHCKNKTLI